MTTNYVLKNGIRRMVVRVLLIVIIVCYMLPWYSVKLPGDSGVTMSGYNMLIGEKWSSIKVDGRNLSDSDVEIMTGILELAGQKRDLLLYPSVFGILAFLLVLISILCTFQSGRSGSIIAAILSFIGLLSMLIVFNVSSDKLDQLSRALQWVGGTAMAQPPFLIMLGAYVMSILAGIVAAIGKYRPENPSVS